MTNTAQAVPEKTAGYCKDCAHYKRIKEALWVECKEKGVHVRRKHSCEEFKNR